jgi:hypothetical protein
MNRTLIGLIGLILTDVRKDPMQSHQEIAINFIDDEFR